MVDISTGPLTKQAYDLCRMIDALPASLENTAACTAASELLTACEAIEIRIKEADRCAAAAERRMGA